MLEWVHNNDNTTPMVNLIKAWYQNIYYKMPKIIDL